MRSEIISFALRIRRLVVDLKPITSAWADEGGAAKSLHLNDFGLRPMLWGATFCPMIMFKFLGEALLLMRRYRGYSQAEAARRAGMSGSQLSDYEQGKVVPKLGQLERLLRAYEATLFDLATILATLSRPDVALLAAERADEIRDAAGTILLREGGMLVPLRTSHVLGQLVSQINTLIQSTEEVMLGRALRAGLADRDEKQV